jgi:transposase-like protein
LYFLGLSFRNAAKSSSFLLLVKISHLVSIWNWIQKYKPKKNRKKKKIEEYSCIQKDETGIKAGSESTWFWIVIEPIDNKSFHLTYQKNEICL